jgi:hypothetical protein
MACKESDASFVRQDPQLLKIVSGQDDGRTDPGSYRKAMPPPDVPCGCRRNNKTVKRRKRTGRDIMRMSGPGPQTGDKESASPTSSTGLNA